MTFTCPECGDVESEDYQLTDRLVPLLVHDHPENTVHAQDGSYSRDFLFLTPKGYQPRYRWRHLKVSIQTFEPSFLLRHEWWLSWSAPDVLSAEAILWIAGLEFELPYF